ncbi:Rft protein-domain-containing protein [Xylogone sp. PMI_703]|nr:Rft protein-domain-containing protein [Xylogone sp. PMI_703]
MGKPKLLSSSATGASLLIGLQLVSRGLTFIANQLLLRYLSPELLGVATQLEVYSISVIFFARESLRVAIQRQNDIVEDTAPQDGKTKTPKGAIDSRSTGAKTQAIVNLAYIPILLGLVFATLLAWLYLRALTAGDPTVLRTPYFYEALTIYGVASFLELLAEPCFVVVQQKSLFSIRATAEAGATVLRCVLTCGTAIWAARRNQDAGLLPFALGQVTYAAALPVIYIWNTWRLSSNAGFSLLATPIYSRDDKAFIFSYFSRPLLVLGSSLFVQSLVKHVLTQGDSLLIASLASQRDQGIYALASNYGGLIARLLFQPVEESSRNYFGKMLSSLDGEPSNEIVSKASKSLHSLLRAYVLLSICILSVGPALAPFLLQMVAGSRWTTSGAGEVLSTYCYYIPLLAINGVTEAFVSSVATQAEVNYQSAWMLAFSAGFAAAAYTFLSVLNLGAEGLVWANALNMAFRIVWGTAFIKNYLKRHHSNLQISTLMPRPITTAAAVGTH